MSFVLAYPLIQKVLDEMRAQGKTRCRHSDGNHTVVGYYCEQRQTGRKPMLRIDVIPREDRQAGK